MCEERTDQPGGAPSAEWSDRDLAAACCKGDREAFGALVARHQHRAFNLAYRLTGSRDDAADTVQEAFLKAYRAMPTFRRESSFYTWLFRIVVNEVRTWRRYQAARPAPFSLDEQRLQTDAARVHRSGAPDPSDEASLAERKRIVEQALQSLEFDERAIIVLRDIEGRDYAEIADALGCAKGTVKSRLHRARMALKQILLPRLGSK